jgi:hypothetical protein
LARRNAVDSIIGATGMIEMAAGISYASHRARQTCRASERDLDSLLDVALPARAMVHKLWREQQECWPQARRAVEQ